MADQFRADALGCGGWTSTPALDRIAAEGTRFSHCLTNSPVCIPARISLATGQYPHSTGVWNNQHHTLDPETPTWMQAIRDAGYRTSVFGKTHLHPHEGDLRDREHLINAYGLDDVDEIGGPRASGRVLSHMTARWETLGLWSAYKEDYRERFANKPHVVRPSVLPLEEYADVYVGRKVTEYIKRYNRPEPWFCWVSFGGPHEPWDTPAIYAKQFESSPMPEPRPWPGSTAVHADGLLEARRAKMPELSAADILAMRRDYAANVRLIDDQIAAIVGEVERRGEWDNTVVVFTSDHGEMNGDAGLIYKTCFLDGAAHVPLLVRLPGLDNPGRVNDSPVELMDVGPTLVELAGGHIRYRQHARSLAPAVASPDVEVRTEAICECDGEILMQDARWSLALNEDGDVTLLFDRADDPEETRNLAGDPHYEAVVVDLRLRLLRRLIGSQRRSVTLRESGRRR